jgi:cytochrome c-type biogenesis protein CcmE
MNSGVKLMAGGLLIATALGYLAFLGASSSWQYYLSVDELVGDMNQLEGKRLRVSGRVAAGTLSIGEHRREATFVLAGERFTLPANCRCLLPDNFAEGISVVIEGTLRSNALYGHKVITQCASKYESKTRSATRNVASFGPSA